MIIMTPKITMKEIAPIILRIAISLVFLWFGSQQLMNPQPWTRLVPDAAIAMTGLSPIAFILFNGSFEIVFGLCLLFGFFTRATALVLGVHLFLITLSLGLTAIGIRDFGLSLATISIFFHGMDQFSLDWRIWGRWAQN